MDKIELIDVFIFFCALITFASWGYAIYLHARLADTKRNTRESEEIKYREGMRELGMDEDEVNEVLADMNYGELVRANKKLKKTIFKHHS